MKTLLCRLFSLAAVAVLVATPAFAADSAAFRLDQAVQAGGVNLPAGVYTFRVADRGIVTIYDDEKGAFVGVTVAVREPLALADLSTSGTLTHDRSVRTLSLGDWRYTFDSGPARLATASVPQVTTVVALAR